MTAQELKNSILQLAIQGKLLPQNPEDENASELIKRIRDERSKWIMEGKIKKEKPLVAIEEDEITAELPDSWVWCRVGEVFVIVRGITFPSEAKNTVNGPGLVPCATTGSVRDTYNYNADVFVSEQFVKRNDQWLLPNDIIMSTANSRELVGKTCIWTSNERKTFGGFLTVLRPGTGILPKYAYYALMSIKASGAFLKTATQTTNIANINTTVLQNTLFPLPPVNEQARIVAKIEELLPLVNEYDKTEKRLTALSAEFPDKLRKSILQQAVQGKLTERDSSDEPATELLKRISAEKAKLIAEGKIKKEKPLSPIEDDEIPFDIPDNWQWVRFSELMNGISTGPFGSMLHKEDYVPDGIPVVNPANIINGKIIALQSMMISENTANRLSSYRLVTGMIVMGRRGEMGRCAIVGEAQDGWLCGTGSFFMSPSSCVYAPYLILFFSSPYAKSYLGGVSIGATMNNLNHNILKAIPIPLPPFAEQQRIVVRVEELFAACNALQQPIEKEGKR